MGLYGIEICGAEGDIGGKLEKLAGGRRKLDRILGE